MRTALVVALTFLLGIIPAAAGATLLGQPVGPGGRVKITFPLSAELQKLAMEGGNPRVETGNAVLVFPARFDPSRAWPVLIVTSTSDFDHTSPMDLGYYRSAAVGEGWVMLASDSPVKPRVDSTQWRLAFLAGAIEAIRKDWPQWSRWPVAMAGYSGGAKRTAYLAPMLVKGGYAPLCGLFLTGVNVDRLTESYNAYRPGPAMLDVPIFLSSGTADKIATPLDHARVFASMQKGGFRRSRLEAFDGEHVVNAKHVADALRWFRTPR